MSSQTIHSPAITVLTSPPAVVHCPLILIGRLSDLTLEKALLNGRYDPANFLHAFEILFGLLLHPVGEILQKP